MWDSFIHGTGSDGRQTPQCKGGYIQFWSNDVGNVVWETRLHIELRREDVYRRIKDEHYRPQIPEDGFLPPAEWIELMTSSWQSDPSLRRTATGCKDIITKIRHKIRRDLINMLI